MSRTKPRRLQTYPSNHAPKSKQTSSTVNGRRSTRHPPAPRTPSKRSLFYFLTSKARMAAPLGKDASLWPDPSAISATVTPEPSGRNAEYHPLPEEEAPLRFTIVPATLPSNTLTAGRKTRRQKRRRNKKKGLEWRHVRRGGGGSGAK